MKDGHLFGDKSPPTFVTRGLIHVAIVFGETNISFRVQNKVSYHFR